MVAVITKSTDVTQLDAGIWPLPQGRGRAPLDLIVEYATKPADAVATDQIRFMRAWTGWIIPLLAVQSENQGAAGAMDFGCYEIDGGDVIDADVFASAVAMTPAVALLDVCTEAGGDRTKRLTRLRDRLAFDDDEADRWVDVVATVTNAGTGLAAKMALLLGILGKTDK